jgi:hypothetical protein
MFKGVKDLVQAIQTKFAEYNHELKKTDIIMRTINEALELTLIDF